MSLRAWRLGLRRLEVRGALGPEVCLRMIYKEGWWYLGTMRAEVDSGQHLVAINAFLPIVRDIE
ncbi:MAG: hypothetical protein ABL949_10430 [Fimbriimonadaceae bacterium]